MNRRLLPRGSPHGRGNTIGEEWDMAGREKTSWRQTGTANAFAGEGRSAGAGSLASNKWRRNSQRLAKLLRRSLVLCYAYAWQWRSAYLLAWATCRSSSSGGKGGGGQHWNGGHLPLSYHLQGPRLV